MTFPSKDYRNPEQVAMRHQEEARRKEIACGQCRERVSVEFTGGAVVRCGIKRQRYGRKCEHFRKTIKRGSE